MSKILLTSYLTAVKSTSTLNRFQGPTPLPGSGQKERLEKLKLLLSRNLSVKLEPALYVTFSLLSPHSAVRA